MDVHEQYMQRCLDLAKLALGNVAPNPVVGSVLVHDNRIIGEGFHQKYGGPHAEVNCIASVHENERHLIPKSTLYVSLEPCAHFGKTPPCSKLIIENNIPKVVDGCLDPFSEVNGKGITQLQLAGIEVIEGVLEEKCKQLNKRFFTFHKKHRPYVVLKWAQTQNGMMGNIDKSRLLISNAYTNMLVHKWRSEEASILVGTNTALADNPSLTVRNWTGRSPVRLVIDMDNRLPESLRLFTDKQAFTLVFNKRLHSIGNTIPQEAGVGYYQVTEDVSLVQQVLNALYQLNIQSVLVEGGAHLLQSFIEDDVWDEARVIINSQLHVTDGLRAPQLHRYRLDMEEKISTDNIYYFVNDKAS